MTEFDKLAIITYNDAVFHDLPLASMTTERKEEAKSKMKIVYPNSGTNLSDGLFEGIKAV